MLTHSGQVAKDVVPGDVPDLRLQPLALLADLGEVRFLDRQVGLVVVETALDFAKVELRIKLVADWQIIDFPTQALGTVDQFLDRLSPRSALTFAVDEVGGRRPESVEQAHLRCHARSVTVKVSQGQHFWR